MRESKFVILRREFLELCQGNFCAAKLIEYFKNWNKWKTEVQRTPWIYRTMKQMYADLMCEHSLHVIRNAIAFLEEQKIITKRKNPGNKQDKTYQYCLNFDILGFLLKKESPRFNSESPKFRSEHPEFTVEQHHNIYPLNQPLTSDPTNTTAEAEKVFEKPDWDELLKKSAEWEATQLGIETEPPQSTDCVDNLNKDYTTNPENPHEGHSPAPHENDNQNLTATFAGFEFKNTAISMRAVPCTPLLVKNEPIAPSAAANSVIEGEEAHDSIKPSVTADEMRDITNQLRGIPCTPAFRVNPQVQACIRKNWQNVQSALAFIKEQIAANAKPKKSWEAWFVFALAEGLKPEKGALPNNFRTWFDEAYRQGLVIASELRSDGVTGVCLAEKVARSLGVGEWVRFEKAVELLQQVQI